MRSLLAVLISPFVALILLAGPAGAQDNCYPSCTTTTAPAPTTEAPASTTTTEVTTTTAADPSGTLSEEASAPPASSTSSPSNGGGSLPITGGDVFSILFMGMITMSVGGALILSAKVRKA